MNPLVFIVCEEFRKGFPLLLCFVALIQIQSRLDSATPSLTGRRETSCSQGKKQGAVETKSAIEH